MICYIVYEENLLRVQLHCYPLFVVSLILLFGEVKKDIIDIVKLLQVQFTSVAIVFIP